MARAVFEGHGDGIAVALDVDQDFLLAEPYGAAALPRQRRVQLSGNPALALAEHVIDRHRDGGHGTRHDAGRRRVLKAAREIPRR